MNQFYTAEFAESLDEQTAFEQLIMQVDADPRILDTLSLEQLVKINKYYRECIRQKADEFVKIMRSLP